MAATYLGLDVGTSSVKALLVDAQQKTVGEATAPLDSSRPHPLWSEQDPDAWVAAVATTVAALRARHAEAWRRLGGVGLSGHMHGATFLDAADKPLRPCILWNDGRSFAECAELEAKVPDFRRRAGNIAMPGFTAPKVMWVAKHEPAVFARTKRVLLPKDYVRLKLTGEAVAEMSDAAGTLWLDIANRHWDEVLLAASGLTLAHMPRLVEGSAVSAYLSPATLAAWSLPADARIPVAGGGGDNAASAVGVGAAAPGEGFVSLGTSGVIFSVTDRYVSLPERTLHAFCHALPGRWHGMSVMLSAASALAWIAGVTGNADKIGALAAAGEAYPSSPERRASAPIFLPYLSGERTPHNDAAATGLFAGLRAEHGADALAYGVLEGVAFAFADGEQVLADAGAKPVRPLLVGGGARSRAWGQLIADATGLTIDLAEGAEAGAALGAARLAMLAAGAGDVKSVCVKPPVVAAFTPQVRVAEALAPRLKRFRALYGAEKATRG